VVYAVRGEAPEWLTCAVCLEVVSEPVQLVSACTHTFCRGCIIKHLERKRDCPECREVPLKKGRWVGIGLVGSLGNWGVSVLDIGMMTRLRRVEGSYGTT
jgi:hypothetical protein